MIEYLIIYEREFVRMGAFFSFLRNLDILWAAPLNIILAVLMGGITGLERGKQGRAAGMRTHMLVCLGATLTAMTGMFAFETLGFDNDPLRISAQVVSGIGFLGVGTILIKGRFQITGLTTAAGLWTVATIGIALGIGFYEGAIVTFIASILAVTVMAKLEYRIRYKHTRFGIYVEIRSDKCVRKTITYLEENFRITDVQVTPPRSGIQGNVGIEANVHAEVNSKLSPSEVEEKLEELDDVVFAIESL